MFLSTEQVCQITGWSAQALRRKVNARLFPEASLHAKTRGQKWRKGLVDDWIRSVERRETSPRLGRAV